MSKKKTNAPAVAANSGKSIKKVNRSRRNSMERKCLPKALKIQFAGSDRATFRTLLEVHKESRKKVTQVMT